MKINRSKKIGARIIVGDLFIIIGILTDIQPCLIIGLTILVITFTDGFAKN